MSTIHSTDSGPPEIKDDQAPAQPADAYPVSTSLPETNSHPEQPTPGRKDENHEQQQRKQNEETQTGYNVGDDNDVVIIECSDDEDIHDISNQAGNNIGNRNGVIHVRTTGNQKEIYGIVNETGNNVGNDNGVVKIGNFGSA